MPTIEIASINATRLGLNQENYQVAIIEEKKMESRSGHFYSFLRKQKGVIVHLGSPEYKDNKNAGFYAGKLVDWNFNKTDINSDGSGVDENNRGIKPADKFQFLKKYRPEINKLLEIAIKGSPDKKICFLTDYQFGPLKKSVVIIFTIREFWKLHDTEGLHFNTMYEMSGK